MPKVDFEGIWHARLLHYFLHLLSYSNFLYMEKHVVYGQSFTVMTLLSRGVHTVALERSGQGQGYDRQNIARKQKITYIQ